MVRTTPEIVELLAVSSCEVAVLKSDWAVVTAEEAVVTAAVTVEETVTPSVVAALASAVVASVPAVVAVVTAVSIDDAADVAALTVVVEESELVLEDDPELPDAIAAIMATPIVEATIVPSDMPPKALFVA